VDFKQTRRALEKALQFGVNPSLDGIRALTFAMGRPQDAFASVQITGTNGKTSVTRLVAAIVAAEGLRTGAYTSPHLESYAERIEIGGAPVSEADFARAVSEAMEATRRFGTDTHIAEASDTKGVFTEFELLTAAALWLMRERGVDVAILEVGMGGRWDATSVVDPAVAVVTGVGLDHTERLGTTLDAIAHDKSHIIKPGSSVVLGPGTWPVADVFLERAARLGLHPRFVTEVGNDSPVAEQLTVRYAVRDSPDRPGGTLTLDVSGAHGEYRELALTAPGYQASNVAVAVAAAECVLGRALRADTLRASLAAMRFPGRFELMCEDPPLVLDGAHNPQAAAVLATAVAEAWPDPHDRPWCVLGILSDKDAEGIVTALYPVVERFVVTQSHSPRARGADELAVIVERVTGARPDIVSDMAEAVAHARVHAGAHGVLVTGSLYTVGEARALWSDRARVKVRRIVC
jgi:dihydrofolate synthase/folylpolyglutamate synthase